MSYFEIDAFNTQKQHIFHDPTDDRDIDWASILDSEESYSNGSFSSDSDLDSDWEEDKEDTESKELSTNLGEFPLSPEAADVLSSHGQSNDREKDILDMEKVGELNKSPYWKPIVNKASNLRYGQPITVYCNHQRGKEEKKYFLENISTPRNSNGIICPEIDFMKYIIDMMLGFESDLFALRVPFSSYFAHCRDLGASQFHLTNTGLNIDIAHFSAGAKRKIIDWFIEIASNLKLIRLFTEYFSQTEGNSPDRCASPSNGKAKNKVNNKHVGIDIVGKGTLPAIISCLTDLLLILDSQLSVIDAHISGIYSVHLKEKAVSSMSSSMSMSGSASSKSKSITTIELYTYFKPWFGMLQSTSAIVHTVMSAQSAEDPILSAGLLKELTDIVITASALGAYDDSLYHYHRSPSAAPGDGSRGCTRTDSTKRRPVTAAHKFSETIQKKSIFYDKMTEFLRGYSFDHPHRIGYTPKNHYTYSNTDTANADSSLNKDIKKGSSLINDKDDENDENDDDDDDDELTTNSEGSEANAPLLHLHSQSQSERPSLSIALPSFFIASSLFHIFCEQTFLVVLEAYLESFVSWLLAGGDKGAKETVAKLAVTLKSRMGRPYSRYLSASSTPSSSHGDNIAKKSGGIAHDDITR
jgi:hypothetical protein